MDVMDLALEVVLGNQAGLNQIKMIKVWLPYNVIYVPLKDYIIFLRHYILS